CSATIHFGAHSKTERGLRAATIVRGPGDDARVGARGPAPFVAFSPASAGARSGAEPQGASGAEDRPRARRRRGPGSSPAANQPAARGGGRGAEGGRALTPAREPARLDAPASPHLGRASAPARARLADRRGTRAPLPGTARPLPGRRRDRRPRRLGGPRPR